MVGDPCRAGDLAWIIRCEAEPSLIGTMVSVEARPRPDEIPEPCCEAHGRLFFDAWRVRFPRAMTFNFNDGPFTTEVMFFPDAWLKPHRPGLLDDESANTGVDRKEGVSA